MFLDSESRWRTCLVPVVCPACRVVPRSVITLFVDIVVTDVGENCLATNSTCYLHLLFTNWLKYLSRLDDSNLTGGNFFRSKPHLTPTCLNQYILAFIRRWWFGSWNENLQPNWPFMDRTGQDAALCYIHEEWRPSTWRSERFRRSCTHDSYLTPDTHTHTHRCKLWWAKAQRDGTTGEKHWCP